jgi:hypothetical protein
MPSCRLTITLLGVLRVPAQRIQNLVRGHSEKQLLGKIGPIVYSFRTMGLLVPGPLRKLRNA